MVITLDFAPDPMRRLRAVLIVMLLGAAGGAIVGVLTLLLGTAISRQFFIDGSYLVLLAAMIGAVWGAVLGPALGFGLLRRVPLGRAIAGTALGALLAGVITFVYDPLLVMFIAPLGMLLAATALRRQVGRKSARADAERAGTTAR